MKLRIRPATAADAAVIAAYNRAMADETEHRELAPALVLAGVKAALEDPAKGFYTVAESESRVVGQVMVTREWSDWRNGSFWWIQSVYVHPDFRGRGIFRALYDFVLEQARSRPDVCGLRLYVEAGNHTAQQVYQRLGMERTSYHVYEVEFQQGGPDGAPR